MPDTQREKNLEKAIEAARDELHILRRRGQEKANTRDHGHDYKAMLEARDTFDDYAGRVREDHEKERDTNRHGTRE
ncbi:MULTISPECIES: hypothetical protein [unclassified Streptomyces]|uniref:hypothetical protein n=1 Tax=unclassified Streptomyces TaxID=2593676 RepID=UPI00081EC4B7|nr:MULTISPECIES: hypothetical protein [unclassified Streptomyces]MYR25135.1 hypothetical protein [Streptomyces sp. SID4945]SCD41750.1 hypothetical protein GA0115251_107019 [Streptomyces sp. TverLS-915]SCE74712.1 hypothetical protein GA0115257_101722 [Streptomyces sp. LcepLS]